MVVTQYQELGRVGLKAPVPCIVHPVARTGRIWIAVEVYSIHIGWRCTLSSAPGPGHNLCSVNGNRGNIGINIDVMRSGEPDTLIKIEGILFSSDDQSYINSWVRGNTVTVLGSRGIRLVWATSVEIVGNEISSVSGSSGRGISVEQKGSEHRDEIRSDGFLSNRSGGTLGGISSGQEIITSIAMKPTSSIRRSGETIDTSGKETDIVTTGRHDPCVGLRAIPIAEAMLALTLMDHYLRHRAQNADVSVEVPKVDSK